MISPNPEGIRRRHGRPMPCPQCGNDVWADSPHICPPGFVKPAREIRRFYTFQSTNSCCRDWLLLGWPEDRTDTWMSVDCQRCGKPLHFDLRDPQVIVIWDEAKQGIPDPPTIVAGRISTR